MDWIYVLYSCSTPSRLLEGDFKKHGMNPNMYFPFMFLRLVLCLADSYLCELEMSTVMSCGGRWRMMFWDEVSRMGPDVWIGVVNTPSAKASPSAGVYSVVQINHEGIGLGWESSTGARSTIESQLEGICFSAKLLSYYGAIQVAPQRRQTKPTLSVTILACRNPGYFSHGESCRERHILRKAPRVLSPPAGNVKVNPVLEQQLF